MTVALSEECLNLLQLSLACFFIQTWKPDSGFTLFQYVEASKKLWRLNLNRLDEDASTATWGHRSSSPAAPSSATTYQQSFTSSPPGPTLPQLSTTESPLKRRRVEDGVTEEFVEFLRRLERGVIEQLPRTMEDEDEILNSFKAFMERWREPSSEVESTLVDFLFTLFSRNPTIPEAEPPKTSNLGPILLSYLCHSHSERIATVLNRLSDRILSSLFSTFSQLCSSSELDFPLSTPPLLTSPVSILQDHPDPPTVESSASALRSNFSLLLTRLSIILHTGSPIPQARLHSTLRVLVKIGGTPQVEDILGSRVEEELLTILEWLWDLDESGIEFE